MAKEGRNICLLVDNCPAHPNIEGLTNVELKFLPPNTTSVIQPCDQGIIQNLKKIYRRSILLSLISHIENGEEDFKPDLYQAIGEVTRAWDQVTPKTIANCWRHGGFVKEDAQEEV